MFMLKLLINEHNIISAKMKEKLIQYYLEPPFFVFNHNLMSEQFLTFLAFMFKI